MTTTQELAARLTDDERSVLSFAVTFLADHARGREALSVQAIINRLTAAPAQVTREEIGALRFSSMAFVVDQETGKCGFGPGHIDAILSLPTLRGLVKEA